MKKIEPQKNIRFELDKSSAAGNPLIKTRLQILAVKNRSDPIEKVRPIHQFSVLGSQTD